MQSPFSSDCLDRFM